MSGFNSGQSLTKNAIGFVVKVHLDSLLLGFKAGGLGVFGPMLLELSSAFGAACPVSCLGALSFLRLVCGALGGGGISSNLGRFSFQSPYFQSP
jgi:hypothetical protein